MTLRTFGHAAAAPTPQPATGGRDRPLTRMRNVRVAGSSIVVVAVVMVVGSHVVAGDTGSSSIVYCCVEPGIVRQLRGSLPDPFHGWLTGDEPPMSFRPGTFVHFVQ